MRPLRETLRNPLARGTCGLSNGREGGQTDRGTGADGKGSEVRRMKREIAKLIAEARTKPTRRPYNKVLFDADVDRMAAMIAAGMSQHQVAARMGVAVATVGRRLKERRAA